MKRCPKCNRSYTTDTQKFCTHDGGILEGVNAGQETIRLDTSQLDDDEPTKAISRDLPPPPAEFDPFKTVMSRAEATTLVSAPETQDISSPAPTLMSPPPPPAATPPSPATPVSIPPPPPAAAPPPPPAAAPPPPPAPPPLPTQRLVGSAPLPPPPLTQAPTQPTALPPVKKKSKLPLVLGILVVLLFLGGAVLGALYWFVGRPMLAARKVVVVEPSRPPAKQPTPNVETTPNDIGKTKPNVPEPPPFSPPSDAVQFVNSKDHLDGQLAEHYVDFSFYYYNHWEKDPSAGVPGARNFVQVERRIPPNFTQENFAVAWNTSAAPVSENLVLFQTLAKNLSAQFEKKFPGYRKVSEGETKVGVYEGYEFRFEGSSLNTARGDLKLWGRVIFLPPQDDSKNGVTLLMLATSLAPELKTLDDVGTKGDLPMLLASFRFGKK